MKWGLAKLEESFLQRTIKFAEEHNPNLRKYKVELVNTGSPYTLRLWGTNSSGEMAPTGVSIRLNFDGTYQISIQKELTGPFPESNLLHIVEALALVEVMDS